MTDTVGTLAKLVRSKNAGPFWLTIDVFLENEVDYDRAVRSALTDPFHVASAYGIPAPGVRIFRLPELRAIKISFPRPVTQGSVHDADLHAGQQYVALLDTPIPEATP